MLDYVARYKFSYVCMYVKELIKSPLILFPTITFLFYNFSFFI